MDHALYTWVCLHDIFLWCLAKIVFSRGPTRNGGFSPKRQKLWFWCWLQPPGSFIPCLHLPSWFLSSNAPKKFLQYLALFVFHPDVKSTSFSGAIASWKPSSTSIKKRYPVKRRNFPTKRRKSQPKGVIFQEWFWGFSEQLVLDSQQAKRVSSFLGVDFWNIMSPSFCIFLIGIFIIFQSTEQELQLGSGVPRK